MGQEADRKLRAPKYRPMNLLERSTGDEMNVVFIDRSLGNVSGRRNDESTALLGALTKGEIRVLEYLDYGVTNKEMCRHLLITENTVKFHLKNIYGKLRVTNRLQAVIAARHLGLISARPAVASWNPAR